MNFLIFIIFVFIVTFAYAGWRGAPWAPTKKEDIARFLSLAQIKPGDKVFDLGCGDGRLLFAAANQGAEVMGYEISLLPYVLAQIKKSFFPKKEKVSIRFRDFWGVDLSEADLVYFFLMPKVYKKLKLKLGNELKPGARVIAYVWPIKGWQEIGRSEKKDAPIIYLYEKK